ncbi:MAG: flavin reductase family protein [Porticoccaceae bacterium]|nr:flavin reductase family protein [Porticoccaceae bacterium]
MSDINPCDLRDTFGSFATGVTGVTTLCAVDSIAKTPVAMTDYNTCFECSVEHKYAGGDHEIIVSRVLDFDNNERASHTNPLLFYRGKYTKVA